MSDEVASQDADLLENISDYQVLESEWWHIRLIIHLQALACHKGTSSSPSYLTADPAPSYWPRKAAEGGPGAWDPRGRPRRKPLAVAPALVAVAI